MRAFLYFQESVYSISTYYLYLACKELGYEIIDCNLVYRYPDNERFIPEFFNDHKLTKDDFVAGSVYFVHKALEYLDIKKPINIDYPKSLLPFMQRDFEIMKLKEFQDNPTYPKFIKPYNVHKLFNGYVVSSFKDLIRTSKIDEDTNIIVQDVVEFKSEWRIYIVRENDRARLYNGGIRYYNGHPFAYPNEETIYKMIDAYDDSPIAYGIDVGVTEDDKTVLIEVNDGFALGNYGLDPYCYLEFTEKRWKELVK